MNRIFWIVVLLFSCSPQKYHDAEEYAVKIKYYADSSINEIVEVRQGQLNGKGLKFNVDGTKMWEFQYKEGLREGTQLEYVHGKLILEMSYSNGKPHGWSRRFGEPCGWVIEEGNYRQGIVEGLWYRYHGRELLEVDLFENDSLIRIVYRNAKFPKDERDIPANLDCK